MHLNWGGGYPKSEVDTLLNGKSDTSHTHTKSQITDFPTLATVATSGSYSDLSNKPTIPTVNNATLTIQKNGSNVATFTSNADSNVTANITVPTKTSDLTNDSGFLTSHQDLSGYIPKAGGVVFTGQYYARNVNDDFLWFMGGSAWNAGANLRLYGKDSEINSGTIELTCRKSNGDGVLLRLAPDGTAVWNEKNLAMQEDTVPRIGGAVFMGQSLARTDTTNLLALRGGTDWIDGGSVIVFGNSAANAAGHVILQPAVSGSNYRKMSLLPSGTWTWNGTSVQITSDKRFKQQISKIDNALLDAWEDVTLVQFKYNDSVNEKGNAARLHTGYVVQQIDTACKSHNVDISDYGLYCHEEYPERTEEVTIENEDGTTSKETKVIEEASEHYSLRYTETLVVECAYLRRENNRLKERLSKIEKLLNI